MLKINIPGRGVLEIENVIFDYNGTLAVDGYLLSGLAKKLEKLSEIARIFVFTADTFGRAAAELVGLKVELKIAREDDQRQQKLDFLNSIGAQRTIAVGNGANDELMLREAALSFCVLNAEGAAGPAVLASDILLRSIDDFFEIVFNPKRIAATLRQ